MEKRHLSLLSARVHASLAITAGGIALLSLHGMTQCHEPVLLVSVGWVFDIEGCCC